MCIAERWTLCIQVYFLRSRDFTWILAFTLCWIGRGQAHVDCIWWSLLDLGPFRRSTVIFFHVFDVCWMGMRQGPVFPAILSIFVLHSQTVLSVGKAAYQPSRQTRL